MHHTIHVLDALHAVKDMRGRPAMVRFDRHSGIDLGVDPNKSTWVDLRSWSRVGLVLPGAVNSKSNLELKSDFTASRLEIDLNWLLRKEPLIKGSLICYLHLLTCPNGIYRSLGQRYNLWPRIVFTILCWERPGCIFLDPRPVHLTRSRSNIKGAELLAEIPECDWPIITEKDIIRLK